MYVPAVPDVQGDKAKSKPGSNGDSPGGWEARGPRPAQRW